VRSLHATESWLGLFGSVTNLSTIFAYLLWQRVIRRWGEGKTLRWTIVAMGLYPLLAGLIPSLTAILLIGVLNGLVSAGVNLTHLPTFLKTYPEKESHNYTALHMTLMNMDAFFSPVVGAALADRFGFAPVLIGCGLLTVLGGLTFSIWPVGEYRASQPSARSQPKAVHS
jgi:MFS family permease